ncbi:hypothetical protein [Sphingobium sp. CAP-1]|uniref:hypothetical protein n=1 Tax=Sphingobium sp. CAP-1 TaxID=2676077 RepID=UPI0012BB41B7|nr:hypothetical protein [Sphingobium sp. CAP-1]QGP78204.1 hypothetical protein GL174_03750 [Sphingobium sp. CAP-1]
MAKGNIAKLAFVGTLGLAAPVHVHAQTLLPAQPGEQKAVISVSATGLYDSNIARASSAALSRRGLEKSDFRLTPLLSADIYKPFGVSYVSLMGSVGYDIHARNSVLDRERIDLTGGAGSKLGPCGLNVTGGYQRRQSDLGDLNVLTTGATATTKNTESIVHAEGLLACGGVVGIKPFAMLNYSDAQNSANQRKGSDSESVTYGGGLLYTQPSIGEIRVYVAQRDVDFPERDGIRYFGAPELRARYAGIRLERNIGARLSGHVQIAYADVDQRGSPTTNNGFDGITWEAGATLRANSRLTLDAIASRSADPSLGFNVDYIVTEDYQLKASYTLNERMTLILTGWHSARDFNYSDTATSIVVNQDKTNRIQASLRIDPVFGRFSLIADAGYANRNADVDFYDYDSVRVGLTLATQF